MDETLARAGIFQGVEPAAAEALAQSLEPVEFPRGHVIFAEGEPGDRLYIIQSGKVKLGRKSPDGRENLLAIMGPSDMFGELSIFDPGPRTSTATTVTEVRALSMDRTALRQWIAIARRSPSSCSSGRTPAAPQRHAGRPHLHRRSRARCQALLQLAQLRQPGSWPVAGHPRLMQEEIAQYVGASRDREQGAGCPAHRGWLRLEGKRLILDRSGWPRAR